jgi:hypothetical protein
MDRIMKIPLYSTILIIRGKIWNAKKIGSGRSLAYQERFDLCRHMKTYMCLILCKCLFYIAFELLGTGMLHKGSDRNEICRNT